MRLLGLALLALPVAYLALSPRLGKRLYRPLLFQPAGYDDELSGAPPVIRGIQADEHYFVTGAKYAPSEKLHAWYFKNISNNPVSGRGGKTVLLSHGNSGNLIVRMPLIQLLLDCGASVLVYDYRGFGRSSGVPTVEGICQDALAAYDFMVNDLGLDKEQIVLYGESLGGALSSWLSGVRPVAGLILQSGFTSLKDIAAERLPFLRMYPDWGFAATHLDSMRVVRGEHPPLLVIHGKLDQVVPYHHGHAVFSTAARNKSMLSVSHGSHGDLVAVAADKMIESITDYLSTL
jgi:fermentation-respiration switch protein FrsA (DUF1100 family)